MPVRRNLPTVILVLIAAATSPLFAENRLTLDVDLDELRGHDLLQFMRAVLPEMRGETSRKPYDLRTLVRLHAHFRSNAYVRNREEELETRGPREELDRLLREALGKIDLPTLRRITLGDGKREQGNPDLFPVLCERWIETEVRTILSERKPKLDFPANPVALPEHLRWFPGMRGSEWERAVGPFAKLLADHAGRSPRGIHQEGASFHELTRAFLFSHDRKAAKVASEFLRFTWDSNCGTGAADFEGAKMKLVMMGLLRERRIAEAVGVSFFVPHAPPWLRETAHPFGTWRSDLLKFCGFDPEALMLAARQLEYLAAAGSEQAALHTLAEARAELQKESAFPPRLEPLTRFLVPGHLLDWDKGDPRQAISPQTQAQIFEFLSGLVREDMPFHQLDDLLNALEDLGRRETKGTLHRLLKHPSTTYAERAARILRALGEDIAPIPPVPPVRFRIYLNGQPWRSTEVACDLGAGYLKTDADGFATIPRDAFLAPGARTERIRFRQLPSRSGGSMWSERQYEEPWVETDVAFPKAFDEVTDVHLAAVPLPLEITYATSPPPVRRAGSRLELIKAGDRNPNAWRFHLVFDERMETPCKFVLSAIAPGSYQLSVNAPGSARFLSEPFEVKAGMQPAQMKLAKGSHVYASISVPQNARGAHEIQLLKDGLDITRQYAARDSEHLTPLFTGVPTGTYRLRVLSTEEFMRKDKITEWKAPETTSQKDLRNEVDCEGVSVDFTIDDGTPALLDLGPVENKPVAAMRDKAGPPRMLSLGPPPH